MRVLYSLIWILLAVGATSCGSQVDSVLLLPSSAFRQTPTTLNYTYEPKQVSTSDGTPISEWRVKAAGTPKGTVVIMGGADANKGRYALLLPIFVDKGWNVVLYDYPGFGDSPGTPSLDSVLQGTRTVLDQAFQEDPVVVGFGFSMGASVLARVGSEYAFAACIFESAGDLWQIGGDLTSFSNLPSVVGDLANLLIQSNTTDDWDMRKRIQDIYAPKLFLHSAEDKFTPWESTWEVFKLAPQPKHMIAMQGNHAEAIFEDPGMYRSLINGWLEGALKLDPIQIPGYTELLADERRAGLEQYGLTP